LESDVTDIEKRAAPPKSEAIANARKALTDRAVEAFIGMDRQILRNMAQEALFKMKPPYRIVVCGGAGSAKTTFSEELGKILEIPTFDLDQYIPGGWVEDEKVYRRAFSEGLNNLWNDVPVEKEWIIEHVEAAGPEVRDLFHPKWAIHLHPGVSQLRAIAKLREIFSGESSGSREIRALSSDKISMSQFRDAPGRVVSEGYGWTLKELR
jgi:hypothetical protein